ncbi:RHS repeat-associated core domain-containing protein [Nitrosomonas europaea]|uniref:RHS repeat-associated core domain-containing protein n=1 Tax=Nitrosomonas europaea TaxID=915 RepID=UPI0023F529B1|nr:RHS repeat-associated core domain-containing protein [Nitrosomonas europaea]
MRRITHQPTHTVDLVAEYNSGGTLLRRYVHGPGVDEPLVWYEGTTTTNKTWLYQDQLGSVIGTANSAGTSTAIHSYGPYGEPNIATGIRFRYTGQQFLGSLNLYYYKARFYSPALGRFLQTDPIGTADDLNLYAYVGNNPINFNDPTGTFAWIVPIATGTVGAVAGGVGYIVGNAIVGSDFSWSDFGVSVGVGAAAGAAIPFTATTISGAIGTGGIANMAQGWISSWKNDTAYSVSQAGVDFLSGGLGGALGGAFTRGVGYGRIGTALPDMVDVSNGVRDLSVNVTAATISRNVFGSIAATVGSALPIGSAAASILPQNQQPTSTMTFPLK